MAAPSRRLAAIMFTDLVRYSALTEKDEAGALRLVELQSEVLRPAVEAHGGRVVKSMGDGFLVEFGSALDAVTAALAARERIDAHNTEHPDARLDVRIGIHAGDVIERDGDVFGDAVNIASRVEPLAGAGGICVSQAVYEQVVHKVEATFTQLDRTALKNIRFPWTIYRLEPRRRAAGTSIDTRTASPLTERTEELDRLRRALENLDTGVGGVILLQGEAGIGKSRLVEEAAREARARGALVATGRAHDADFEPPLAVWLEALRGLIYEIPPADLLQAIGLQAVALGPYLPDLVHRLGGPSPSLDAPEPDRFVVYDAIAHLLANASRQRPLLLCLEDLQWADAASLKLLEFVLRAVEPERVLCLGTYRSEEIAPASAFAATLRELARIRPLERIVLGPLSEPGVSALAAAALGAESVDPGLVAALHRRTLGNPLFVDEMVWVLRSEHRVAVVDGRAELTGGPIPAPPSIQQLVGRRIQGLAPATQELLRTASILGCCFRASLLASFLGSEREEFLTAVEEALRSGVLRETPIDSDSDLSFVDARVRDGLYESVSFLRRRALHGAAAERLAAKGAPADELAYHFREARRLSEACRHLERAGDEALLLSDFNRATGRWREALADLPEDDREGRRRIGVKLGRALQEAGRNDEARRALLAARTAVLTPEDDVPIAIWMSAVALRQGNLEESRAEMARALTTVGDQETPDAADAWSGWCVLLMAEGRPREAIDAGRRTLAIARRLGTSPLLVQALNNLTHAYLHESQWEAAVACVNERLEAANEGVRPFEAAITLHDAGEVHASALADFAKAADFQGQAAERFARMGAGTLELSCRLGRAHALTALGHVAEAEQEVASAIRLAEEVHATGLLAFFRLLEARIAYVRGDLSSAEGLIQRLLEEAPTRMEERAHLEIESHLELAAVSAELGELDRARREFAPWWHSPHIRQCGHCAENGSYVAALIESTAPRGDPGIFHEAIDLMVSRGTRFGRARIAASQARWERFHGRPRFDRLSRTEAYLRQLATPFPLARTLAEHAACAEALGRTDEARALRQEARDLFRKLGADRRAAQLDGPLREGRPADDPAAHPSAPARPNGRPRPR